MVFPPSARWRPLRPHRVYGGLGILPGCEEKPGQPLRERLPFSING